MGHDTAANLSSADPGTGTPRGGPSPLWAVLLFTGIASLGTGAVTNGVFFIAQSGYGFDRAQNALLGIVLGIAYIGGALGVGPGLRRLAAAWPSVSTRMVVATLLAMIAVVLALPMLLAEPVSVQMTGTGEDASGEMLAARAPEWTVWLLIAVFAPATGAMWPIVESYLSGGRRDQTLRRAIARFNWVWAGAVALALWAMAPLWDTRPLLVLAGLGGLHLLAAWCLVPMGAEPGKHLDDHPHATPEGYAALLRLFRGLLAASYIFLSALGPALPTILDRLEVIKSWQTPISSTWQVARVGLFVLLGVLHGWHGKRWPAWAAATGLVVGFGLASSAAAIGSAFGEALPGVGVAALGVGLAVFGSAMAAIYKGALYYAMEVGSAAVDAGGAHEALIGVGYTLGPLCTLLAALAVRYKYLPPESFGPAVTAASSVLAATVVIAVLARGRAKSQDPPHRTSR